MIYNIAFCFVCCLNIFLFLILLQIQNFEFIHCEKILNKLYLKNPTLYNYIFYLLNELFLFSILLQIQNLQAQNSEIHARYQLENAQLRRKVEV